MTKRRGFTLIELLVVIAIIGILSSVVLASLNSTRTKARDTRRVSDVKQLQLALEIFYDANGSYPAALSSLVGSTGGASMSQLPADPSGGSYVYATNAAATPSAYHLGANLEQNDTQTTLLDGDRDFDSITAPNDWTATGGFDGDDAGTCAAVPAATAFCYDISNI